MTQAQELFLINNRYWTELMPYSGRHFDKSRFYEEATIFKREVLRLATGYINKGKDKKSFINDFLYQLIIGTAIFNKGLLFTSVDAVEALEKLEPYIVQNQEFINSYISENKKEIQESIKFGILNALYARGASHYFLTPYWEQNKDMHNSTIYEILNLESAMCNYHDCLSHYLADVVKGQPNYFDTSTLTDRLFKDKPLNVHAMFGTILMPIFRDKLAENKSQREIGEETVALLVEYLIGETVLTNRDGYPCQVRPPMTLEEAKLNLDFHSNEIEASYHEYLVYYRYRPDVCFPGEALPSNYPKLTLLDRLKAIASMGESKTIYQDSFYLRDEILQTALKEVIRQLKP
jgi:hypothetical protein